MTVLACAVLVEENIEGKSPEAQAIFIADEEELDDILASDFQVKSSQLS